MTIFRLDWAYDGKSRHSEFNIKQEDKFFFENYFYFKIPDLFELTSYGNSSFTSILMRK